MKKPKYYYWSIVATFAIAVIFEGFTIDPNELSSTDEAYSPISIIIAFVVFFNIFKWNQSHRYYNGITSFAGAPIVCALIPPLGIPIYFLHGMGYKRGGIETIKFLGFVFSIILLSTAILLIISIVRSSI